jgi:endonuclease/exonuclease/phosphatase family metal-dependent hydrolase
VTDAIVRLNPDVVCLQEVLEEDYLYLRQLLCCEGTYVTSARVLHGSSARQVRWGLAILTRLQIQECRSVCYSDDAAIRDLVEPNDPRRYLLVGRLKRGAQEVVVATTHFTWSALGQASSLQRADFARLKAALSSWSTYVLCGDMNAPRGREMFSRFTQELLLVDNVPAEVTSTIDGQFHHAGDLGIVVDGIFSTPDVRVQNVEVLDGLSDHKALFAQVAFPSIVTLNE